MNLFPTLPCASFAWQCSLRCGFIASCPKRGIQAWARALWMTFSVLVCCMDLDAALPPPAPSQLFVFFSVRLSAVVACCCMAVLWTHVRIYCTVFSLPRFLPFRLVLLLRWPSSSHAPAWTRTNTHLWMCARARIWKRNQRLISLLFCNTVVAVGVSTFLLFFHDCCLYFVFLRLPPNLFFPRLAEHSPTGLRSPLPPPLPPPLALALGQHL